MVKIDIRTKRLIFRLGIISCGLYAIYPVRVILSPILDYPIIGGITPILALGIITLIYMYGVIKNKW